MKHLAVVNFSQTVDHLASEKMRSFLTMTEAVYHQASNSAGHIASARPADDRDDLSYFDREWGHWGKFTVPYYYAGGFDSQSTYEASALSVWKDIQALRAFTYSGIHVRSIQRKAKWFALMDRPNYAMWWTEEWPTWAEATKRLEYQENHELSPYSFTFRKLFDPDGNPIKLQGTAG